jgi:hypothetical protein
LAAGTRKIFASNSHYPQRIPRGFETPDDQTRAETNCKVILEARYGNGNWVVHAANMKHSEVNVVV